MQSWKQAFWLLKFEFKVSKKSLLLLVLSLFVMLISLVPSLTNYLEKSFKGVDFFFLFVFWVVIFWAKPKNFQIQKVRDGLWVSPFVVMLNQLPITKDAIVKHRFLSYVVFSISFNVLLLGSLYAVTPALREAMSPGTYIVFAVIWLSFGIYGGWAFPVQEAGDNSMAISVIISFIIGIFVFLGVLTIFHKQYGHGVVYWTIDMALHWPVISIIGSFVLAAIGAKFWMRVMRKKLEKIDY